MTRFIVMAIALLPALALAQSSEQADEAYTLTISGGISLGAYEAGLNWLLVKDLRSTGAELAAITGASAGSINTLLTALTWCADPQAGDGRIPNEVDDNPFRRVWLAMDLEKFLPGRGAKIALDRYGKDDGLLSRKFLLAEIDALGEVVDHGVFDEGCELPLGVAMTRAEPVYLSFADDAIDLPVQTHHVVLEFKATADGAGFWPRRDVGAGALSADGAPLSPPQDGSGQVPFKVVSDYLIASAAFPIAFGRVNIPHCVHRGGRARGRRVDVGDLLCPAGTTLVEEEFLDGGVFDNVPMGLARQISKPAADLRSFFIDPDVRVDLPQRGWDERCQERFPQAPECRSPVDDEMTFGLGPQLRFFGPAVNVARTHILAGALRQICGDDALDRECRDKLVVTQRRLNITGGMLGAFAAFYAYGFREYDYYVGVYDGITSRANDRCRRAGNVAACTEREFAAIRDAAGVPESPIASRMIATFEAHRMDPGAACRVEPDANAAPHLLHLLAIHHALNCSAYRVAQTPTFPEFVKHLKARGFCGTTEAADPAAPWTRDCSSELLRSAIQDPEAWYGLLALRATGRLRKLEDDHDRHQAKRAEAERQRYRAILGRLADADGREMNTIAREECESPDAEHAFFCETWRRANAESDNPVRTAVVWADILARSYVPADPGFHLSPSANPTAYFLLPYSFGFDGTNGGLAFQYRPGYRFANGSRIEIPITPYYWGFDAQAADYSSVGAAYSLNFRHWGVSSLDFGVHYVRDHDDRFGRESAGVSIGGVFLLQRLRAELLYRPDYDGKELQFVISLNDIPSWLPRRYEQKK